MARHSPEGNPAEARESPYFLWDRDLSTEELRAILDDPAHPKRLQLLALLLREARPTDVWNYVSPTTVWALWPKLEPRLGRRRALWTWVFESWRELGFLG